LNKVICVQREKILADLSECGPQVYMTSLFPPRNLVKRQDRFVIAEFVLQLLHRDLSHADPVPDRN
jgi:hypothetical protein